jgi:hypothetical protein
MQIGFWFALSAEQRLILMAREEKTSYGTFNMNNDSRDCVARIFILIFSSDTYLVP